MNDLTPNKKIVLGVLVIILIAISFLFLKGEVSLKKASQGYNIIAFQNTNQNIDSQDINDTLSFYIQNLEKKNNEYRITFLINDESISSLTEKIKSGEQKTISPPQKVTEKIKDDNLGLFKYKVEVISNNEKEIIYKQINK